MDAGHEVIGISSPGPDVAWLEERGLRHVPLTHSTRSMNVAADLRAARELKVILYWERPDVLHTHNPKPGLYGRVVGRLAGVPRVVNTCHGLYATPDDPLAKRAVVYGLEAVASRFSHAELVQNHEDLDLMARLHLVARRKIELLGNGVDLQRFRPDLLTGDERAELRRQLGFAPDDVVVGTVGRLVVEKGYRELFAAAGRLPDHFRLLVVGGDDAEKADRLPEGELATARERGAVLLGHRDDVERLYQVMDVFVLASHREGFPRAAMEAAASGLPVVATAIRGCRQVVENRVTGLLIPLGDVHALAIAIESAVDIEPRLCRQRAEQHFDAAAVNATVLGSYEGRTRTAAQSRAASSRTKRLIDITCALVGLVILAPVLAAVAIAVRIFHGKPVLFRQRRPGLHGAPFIIYKFRTMRDAVDDAGNPLPDGDRLTRFGRLLRASSLDELPELINVIKGEMSLVGPRPLLMEYLDRYTAEERQRHLVRPGLTGLAQISGRNSSTWETRLAFDVEYIREWSVALDLAILWKTMRTVTQKGGISHDGHDTMPFLRNGR